MTSTTVTQALSFATASILRPLVRTLLRHGIGYGLFAEHARRVYVEVAREPEFRPRRRTASDSHVAVITGLTRKEVRRIARLALPGDLGDAERYNRAARVVSGWVRDPRFRDRRGDPAPLPLEGGERSFAALVKKYSGDAPVRAVLDELVRVGVVERAGAGQIGLIGRSYIPKSGDIDKIGILGRDTADLIATIDHNIRRPDEPFFQRKVSYDNLPAEALPGLRALAAERGQPFLELFDGWLSARDRDVTSDAGGTGRKRAGIGIFYFEEDVDGEGGGP